MFMSLRCLTSCMSILSHHLAFHPEICQDEKPTFSPMRSSFQRSLAFCAILFVSAIAAPPAVATTKETIAVSVGNLLQEGHYTRQKLNEELSKKFLQTYLELLDYSHLFFTQQDVDALNAKYGNSIAGDVLLGTLKPAYEIYDLYAKRV